MKERNKGLWRELKGTKAKEENKRLREEIKGAESADGRNKMHDGKIKCEGERRKNYGRQ